MDPNVSPRWQETVARAESEPCRVPPPVVGAVLVVASVVVVVAAVLLIGAAS